MQKFHTLLAWLLVLLLVLHLILGAITLTTEIHLLQGLLPTVFLALVLLHAVLALYKVSRKKGFSHAMAYGKRNHLYWLRIFSGVAVLALVFVHRVLWTIETPFGVLLKDFEWPSLLVQMLFMGLLALHILLNIRPLLIDSGLDVQDKTKKRLGLFPALLFAAGAAAVVLYFLRGAL